MDLIRTQRGVLFMAGLITEEEHAELLSFKGEELRLSSYFKVRRELEELRKTNISLSMEVEDLKGDVEALNKGLDAQDFCLTADINKARQEHAALYKAARKMLVHTTHHHNETGPCAWCDLATLSGVP